MDKDAKLNKEVAKTYADDIAKIIGSGEGGIVKKIIHGEEEHQREKVEVSPESKKNKMLMFVSLILLTIAVVVFGFLIFFHNPVSTVDVVKSFTPFIFNDKSIYLDVKDLKRDAIIQSIRNEVDTNNIKEGEVEGVYLSVDKKLISFQDFIRLINANLVLNPSIDTGKIDEHFMLGIAGHNTGDLFNPKRVITGGDVFLLIKVRSLPEIFEIFHNWENKMFFDLHDLFNMKVSPETESFLTKNFDNGIIENKNARILYGNENQIVLMYVFVNDNYVLIANKVEVVKEVISRLTASKVGK